MAVTDLFELRKGLGALDPQEHRSAIWRQMDLARESSREALEREMEELRASLQAIQEGSKLKSARILSPIALALPNREALDSV